MAQSPSPVSLPPDANQRAWLDTVAGWFGQVERRASHGGIFTTVQDLWDEMQRFIRQHNNRAARSCTWTKDAAVLVEKLSK